MKNIFCPISTERVDEQVHRLTALLVMVLMIVGFAAQSPLVLALLVVDFVIRAFSILKFSPLSCLANWLSGVLRLPEHLIDKAPKLFAARMGFAMALAILGFYIAGFVTAAKLLGLILVFFAGLEFSVAFCAGCAIYTYLVLPFYRS